MSLILSSRLKFLRSPPIISINARESTVMLAIWDRSTSSDSPLLNSRPINFSSITCACSSFSIAGFCLALVKNSRASSTKLNLDSCSVCSMFEYRRYRASCDHKGRVDGSACGLVKLMPAMTCGGSPAAILGMERWIASCRASRTSASSMIRVLEARAASNTLGVLVKHPISPTAPRFSVTAGKPKDRR